MRIKTIWVYLWLKTNFVNEVLTQRRRVESGYRLKALGYRNVLCDFNQSPIAKRPILRALRVLRGSISSLWLANARIMGLTTFSGCKLTTIDYR